jgi:hypothetical protein
MGWRAIEEEDPAIRIERLKKNYGKVNQLQVPCPFFRLILK